MVKNLISQGSRHRLGWEDPLEKEMATHSSILAWKIPWTEEPQSMGSQRVRVNLVTKSPQRQIPMGWDYESYLLLFSLFFFIL